MKGSKSCTLSLENPLPRRARLAVARGFVVSCLVAVNENLHKVSPGVRKPERRVLLPLCADPELGPFASLDYQARVLVRSIGEYDLFDVRIRRG